MASPLQQLPRADILRAIVLYTATEAFVRGTMRNTLAHGCRRLERFLLR